MVLGNLQSITTRYCEIYKEILIFKKMSVTHGSTLQIPQNDVNLRDKRQCIVTRVTYGNTLYYGHKKFVKLGTLQHP